MFVKHSSKGAFIKQFALAAIVMLNFAFSILFLLTIVFNGMRQPADGSNLVKEAGNQPAPKAVVTLANIE